MHVLCVSPLLCVPAAAGRDLMDAIEKGVNDIRSKNKECKNMRYMRIDGETPARQREENVTAFQNDENCRVRVPPACAVLLSSPLLRTRCTQHVSQALTAEEL